MQRLKDFPQSLLPPSKRQGYTPTPAKAQPRTPPEKQQAMSKERVAKLVEGFTNTLEEGK